MFPYFFISIMILFFAFAGKNYRIGRVMAFVLVSLFVGLRYNVGTDYDSYVSYFNTSYFFLEPGFSYIVTFLNERGYGVVSLFLVMSIATYFFLFAYVETNKDIGKAEYFPVIMMLTLLTITTTCNGIRQAFAVSIFMFSSIFIIKRKIITFILLIAFGLLFHTSILIVLPLYFLKDIHLKSWMYIIIYILSFTFMTFDLQSLVAPFQFLIENNERYMNMVDSNYGFSYLGLGNLLQIMSYIVLLWLSLRNNMHTKYPLYFNLFFISCVLMNMTIGASLFSRVMMYFSWFMYILLPLTLKEERNINIRKILALYYVLWFIVSSVNYIMFDKVGKMLPYHDVLGIF